MTRRILAIAALVGAFAGLWAAPAAADPTRDDVMTALQRCAGFTDNRTWLNCYYGAAQPMRAQLGLSPAPDSQVSLVGTAPVPTPPPMTATASTAKSGGGWFSGITDIFDGTSTPSDSDSPSLIVGPSTMVSGIKIDSAAHGRDAASGA